MEVAKLIFQTIVGIVVKTVFVLSFWYVVIYGNFSQNKEELADCDYGIPIPSIIELLKEENTWRSAICILPFDITTMFYGLAAVCVFILPLYIVFKEITGTL